MVKSSNTSLCSNCQERIGDAILGLLCHVCYRKNQISTFSQEQQEAVVADIIPERYQVARMEHLNAKLQDYLEKEVSAGLLLWGPAGSGKTYAMAALARKRILEGFTVARISYELLCLQLRDTFKGKTTDTEWGVIQQLINCDMLFLEDVGTTKSEGQIETDFSVRTLLVLLDTRLEHCRPTFITSNKTLESLEASFDERVGSRLKLYKNIGLADTDKRKRDCEGNP